MATGRFGSTSVNQAQKFPSVGSYVAKVKGPKLKDEEKKNLLRRLKDRNIGNTIVLYRESKENKKIELS